LTYAIRIGYQTEIDNITKRTKYAENAFLTVYKLLTDAPDPAPLFEAAVVSQRILVTSLLKYYCILGAKCQNSR
jgi:hypothetical protein